MICIIITNESTTGDGRLDVFFLFSFLAVERRKHTHFPLIFILLETHY